MSKSLPMRVILIFGSVLILAGVMLTVWIHSNQDAKSEIVVQLKDGKSELLEFEKLDLVPGEECVYSVKLKKTDQDRYKLKLDFIETEEKTLKNYARVKILSSGESIYDELLATAFEDESVLLSIDFSKMINTELEIVYYLPLDVGNEAKNAEAMFELRFTSSID